MTTSSATGQKLWNYCNVLRDAGLSYGDCLEPLTYLISLKMMYERTLLSPLYPAARLSTGPDTGR
jgi:type I restriction enzyme M protein